MEDNNKNTQQAGEPIEYGIDAEDIQRRAEQNLAGNREYRRLKKDLERLDQRSDFVKLNLVKTKMRVMMNEEIDRLWALEMERRKEIRGISDLLRQKDRAEYDHWQELLASFSFAMDMIDFTIHDVNELLEKNNIGIKMEKFKEIEDARALAKKLTGDNLKHSKQWHKDMWYEESDRLWEYMKERCATYRRKVDRRIDREKNGEP